MAFGLKKVASINGERYVYYNRLLDDGYIQLYHKAYNQTFLPRMESGGDPLAIAAYFLKLRNAEYRKECLLLQTQFGVNITGQYSIEDSDPEMVGQQLIHAFNSIFNIKEVFNYHLGLIKETQGQKGVITYFHSYFNDEWKQAQPKLFDALRADFNATGGDNLKYILSQYMEMVVKNTLYYMYNDAKIQNGIQGTIYDIEKPYKELAELLTKHDPIADELVQGMIQNYHLDEFVNSLSKDLQGVSKLTKGAFNDITKKSLGLNFSVAGISKELEAVAIAKIMAALYDNKFHATHTGGTNAKTDWTFIFNIDPSLIDEAFSGQMFGEGREAHVAKAQQLSNALKNVDNGFIVYTSGKDYTLNSKFTGRGGMQADRQVKLATWEAMLQQVGLASQDIIFSIMQTIPGAIGQDNLDNISQMMARAIAGAMFDDFDVAGSVPESGAKAIHLLHLNGIYIPLSFYYDKLYKAFQYAGTASDLIRVNINTPPMILFPDKSDQALWQEQNPGESPWRFQGDVALQEITLSYHFFANFRKAMEEVNIIL